MQQRIYLFICVLFTLFSCQPSPQVAKISGKIVTDAKEISIGQETIELDSMGYFSYSKKLDHPTILNLQFKEFAFEVFVASGKEVKLEVEGDSIQFSGDLLPENEQLKLDKKTTAQITEFLNSNWYQLHRKKEPVYKAVLDSLQEVYLLSMQDQDLDPTFVAVNTASIRYGFDRMLLRYPQNHYRFTGNKIALSADAKAGIRSAIERPEHRFLESYQKYSKWLLEEAISKALVIDTSIYYGANYTTQALELIEQTFENKSLKDFWSWEYIRSHLEQYTWINGKDYLGDFKELCSTPDICRHLEAYEKDVLAKRKDHDILVYKNAKGYQLEAHIFRPENFDAKQNYPALAAFHGGGWMLGNASWTFESAQRATQWGMIGISVEYRLSNRTDITPFEAMEDARDFMIWLRKNAAALQIDPDRVIAKGISAGGHLVNAISVLQKGQTKTTIPNALLLVSPAIDMQDPYIKSLFLDGMYPEASSPLSNLAPGLSMPPVLILQGRTDRVTPTKYAEAFQQKMDALGYNSQLIIYEGCGHLFTPSHLDDTKVLRADPEIAEKSYQEQAQFLKRLDLIK